LLHQAAKLECDRFPRRYDHPLERLWVLGGSRGAVPDLEHPEIAELQCIQGDFEPAEATVNSALKVLDASNPEQAKWIKSFQDQLAKCRENAPR